MNPYRFAWIGGGQLSRSLLPALIAAGHQCQGWQVRRPESTTSLQGCSGLRTQQLNLLGTDCQFLFFAISDDALPNMITQFKGQLPKKTACIHFSATTPASIFKPLQPNSYGVCYPLQSFANYLPPNALTQVPFFIEGSDKALEQQLITLVASLGARAQPLNAQKRQHLHLAAVLTNNFGNHLLTCAQQHMQQAGLPLAQLQPLLEHTLKQALLHGPEGSQSGPARRNDTQTMATHAKLLAYNPRLLEVYRLLSQDIAHTYTIPPPPPPPQA